MLPTAAAPALIADLGATNARFGLVGPEGVTGSLSLRCADYPGLAAAARAYLATAKPPLPPRRAAFAVASAITGDRIVMTNNAWSFSVRDLTEELGLDQLQVINDFTAVALGCPALGPGDAIQVGGGTAEPGMPIAVMGAGTGLGVSGLVPGHGGWTALSGEGGHVTMPAVTEREAAVIERMGRRFGHVSAERLLSGMGIVNLYETLAALEGLDDAPMRGAEEVTEAALGGSDALSTEATEMFCAMLGTIAGNLVLTLGARGGLYVAGGIVPKLGDFFLRSAFRDRFEAKGRFRPWLAAIPTFVVTHPLPAFLGLRTVLDDTGGPLGPGLPTPEETC